MLAKTRQIFPYLFGYWTHVFFLIIIVIGMPFSKFLMSVGTIGIAANWFLEGGVKQKFKTFFNNRTALIMSSGFLVFVFGMIFTQNFNYGINDLRIKLPLLVFPILLSTTHKLKKNHFFLVVKLFVIAVLFSSFYGFLVWKNIAPAKKEILELRDLSQFVSHIRLSLMLILSMFLIPKLFFDTLWAKIFGWISIIWAFYFLSLIESATGFSIGFVTLFFVSLYYILKKKSVYGFISVIVVLLAGIYLSINLTSTYHKVKMDISKPMDEFTKSGEKYATHSNYVFFDNGNYTNHYLAENEIRVAWENISELPYYGNKTEEGVRFILIRYLTSKGWRKDKEGFAKLSKQDIENIGNRIPNYLHASPSFMARIHKIMFEIDGYLKGVNASGNSLSQRFEYWKMSLRIIEEKPIFGHGTGDVPAIFEQKYKETPKSLNKKYQLRSHNQYFSTAIAVGLLGLLLFLFSLFVPIKSAFKNRNYFYLVCMSISLLSFLSEDTLETQEGVFFYAFLSSLFLFASKNRYVKIINNN